MRALAASILLALAVVGCGSPRGNAPASPNAESPSAASPAGCSVSATPSYPATSPSPPTYGDRVVVSQGQTVTRPFTVSPSLSEVVVQSGWTSGDVRISLISPSGRVVDRTTVAPDVLNPGSVNGLTLVVKKPEAGQWTIQIIGVSVPASGEEVAFSVNQIPLSDFGPIAYVGAVPDRGVAPLTIEFETPNSGAPLKSFRWNFGDCSAPGTSAKLTHLFTSAGTYAVSVTVTDSNGQTDTADREIVVTAYNHTPTASFLWGMLDPAMPTFVGFSAQPSKDVDGQISSYAWTFGDGTKGTGITNFHSYSKAGTYRVSLTVTDDGGLTAMACQLVATGVQVGPTAACPA